MRTHEFACTIGADTKEDLVAELYDLARRLERGEITHGVMGGAVVGSIYSYSHSPHVTHDSYFKVVNEHIARNAATQPLTSPDTGAAS